MSKYSIIKVTSIIEVENMDIHNIIAIILTLTFFIIFSYYPKEAAKAQKISLLNMGILITILFLLIFIFPIIVSLHRLLLMLFLRQTDEHG